jgi:putative FmdB family regulatory protein
MPLYTYNCKECNHTWNERHSISERAVPEALPCPFCSAEHVIQQIITSAPGFSTTGGKSSTAGMQVPSWYKDKINNINKDLGLKVQSDIS